MRLLVVANPFPASGGGCYRAAKSLTSYPLHGIEPYLLIPPIYYDTYDADTMLKLISGGVRILGLTGLYNPGNFVLKRIRELFYPLLPKVFIDLDPGSYPSDFHAVLSFHETWDSLWLAYFMSSRIGRPSIAVLQLPPYYASRNRLKTIREARRLNFSYVYGDSVVSNFLIYVYGSYRDILDDAVYTPRFKSLLNGYSLIIGISRSICVEMGLDESSRVHCMDPGVTLDEGDLELIKSIREKTREKKNYIVLGGRPSWEKGIAEALLVFEKVSRRFPNYKLYITGKIRDYLYARLRGLARKLGIEDKVVFTGFLPREERLRIVAESRLVLYPSHVDAYPYAVAESLLLGTPIVAYSIPAIDIYYRGLEGVRIVKELDLEAMADESIDMLSQGNIEVESPRLRSWDDIIREEVNLLKHVAETS